VDLMGGQVTAMTEPMASAYPHVKDGKLRALAIGSPQRNPTYPDTPTVAESGYPGFSSEYWFGLSAPAGLPAPVFQKLFEATRTAMQSPAIQEKLGAVGLVIPQLSDPKQFVTLVDAE
ncbi:tripartite tricarboxylate transporter substrate binding protein, partial [Paenibacillus polymyxa]|nr:tripartite tricarboxylate transporter substrate binding protein [Paenibacillus polymyxa]